MQDATPRVDRRASQAPPAIPGEIVRPRLLAPLAHRFSSPVTTVVAGPGFGKTTLLAQALRANQADPQGIDAWVSCEPGDGDAVQLAAAVLDAVGGASGHGDPVGAVLDALARIAPLPVCLVLDDLHEVPEGSTGAELLADVLARMPAHVHLVLSSRRPPPVPLARRRAAGDVVDLDVEALSFTPDEIRAVAGRAGRPIEGLDDLAGWPSLVRLALSAPVGSAPQFLWEEVIAALDGDQRDALLALATLGWGTARDVATVAGVSEVDLDGLASSVPLLRWEADGRCSTHALWEDAVERLFSVAASRSFRTRTLHLLAERGEMRRMGWRALRWRRAPELALAARHLVRDTFGALPVDTAERWLAEAPDEARDLPDMRLLALAVRHTRHLGDPGLDRDVDSLVGELAEAGDHDATAVALAFGAIVAHARGDLPRLLEIHSAAGSLAGSAAEQEPILAYLTGAIDAAVASLQGDVEEAIAATAALDDTAVPSSITEVVVRLHVAMLGLAGRADEALAVGIDLADADDAWVRSIPDHTRWLAGDPGAFTGRPLDAGAVAVANDRDRMFHATHLTMVAASLGDAAVVEALRPAVERVANATADPRDQALTAAAQAVRLVLQHDDAGAAAVIRAHVDQHPATDRLGDVHLRRLLAVGYVSDPRLAERWSVADLGPTLARQRAVADLLLAARAARLRADAPLPSAEDVLTTLPAPWSAELAVRAHAAGHPHASQLALALSDLAPASVHRELRCLLEGVPALRDSAAALLREVPDPSRPAVSIRVLGPLEVDVGGRRVTGGDVRRRRVQALVELLAVMGPLRRERVAELLWGDRDPGAAARNLRVTLSRARSVVDPHRRGGDGAGPLRLEGDLVALARTPTVEVDLWRFRELVAVADVAARRGDAGAEVEALEQAVGLWRGDPCPALEDVLEAVGDVEALRVLLAETAVRLGELLLVSGRPAEAAVWAERACRALPYAERAHRLAVAAHLQAGDLDGVDRAAGVLAGALEEVGVEPERSTRMVLRQVEARRVG